MEGGGGEGGLGCSMVVSIERSRRREVGAGARRSLDF